MVVAGAEMGSGKVGGVGGKVALTCVQVVRSRRVHDISNSDPLG